MKNYKKGFVGIIVAIAIVAVGFLGYGAYKAFHEDSTIQISDSVNVSNTRVSEQMILDALNKNGGGCITEQGVSVPYTKGSRGFGCSSDVTTLYVGDFHYGDINNDGFDDVVFSSGSCGASCGNSLMVGLNQKNGTIGLVGITPKTWVTSGAAQSSLKNIIIVDGVISISANGYSDSKNWDDVITKKFKFENDKLIEIKSNVSIASTSNWNRFDPGRGFEFKYPTDWKIGSNIFDGRGVVFAASFCPPQLFQDGDCKYTQPRKDSYLSMAPVLLSVYSRGNLLVNNENKNIWQDSLFTYELMLNDDSYRDVYNQIISTFKLFTK